MLRLDPAAVQWSAPERERAGRPLLVLAHGRGADERDLFGLSPYLPLRPVVASVRAPIAEGPGWSWFPADRRTPEGVMAEDADAAAQALLDWLDGVDTSAGVGVLGFSQGAILALQAIRLQPRRLDWVVALAGYVPAGEHPGDVRLRELPPPVFTGRGEEDTVVLAEAAERSLPWLATHTTLTERIYPGLGHSISQTELRDVSRWIAERIG